MEEELLCRSLLFLADVGRDIFLMKTTMFLEFLKLMKTRNRGVVTADGVSHSISRAPERYTES